MTKAKARKRAKAKAAQKIRKRQDNAEQPGQNSHAGKFDPGAFSIKGPSSNASTASFAPAKRGSARSN